MTNVESIVKAIFAEFDRLGLALSESPYQGMAAGPGGPEALLDQLRTMQPGVTWRDVHPDMPSHWVIGRPETWTHPYEPLGPFDFPTPPAAPAIFVGWTDVGATPLHAALVERARSDGWPVYGGAATPERSAALTDDIGFIVLERGTSEERMDEMCRWLFEQPGVDRAYPYRHEGEEYAPDDD